MGSTVPADTGAIAWAGHPTVKENVMVASLERVVEQMAGQRGFKGVSEQEEQERDGWILAPPSPPSASPLSEFSGYMKFGL